MGGGGSEATENTSIYKPRSHAHRQGQNLRLKGGGEATENTFIYVHINPGLMHIGKAII